MVLSIDRHHDNRNTGKWELHASAKNGINIADCHFLEFLIVDEMSEQTIFADKPDRTLACTTTAALAAMTLCGACPLDSPQHGVAQVSR